MSQSRMPAQEGIFPGNSQRGGMAKKRKCNPWAICTESVGRDDKDKYERCVLEVKKTCDWKEASVDWYTKSRKSS